MQVDVFGKTEQDVYIWSLYFTECKLYLYKEVIQIKMYFLKENIMKEYSKF